MDIRSRRIREQFCSSLEKKLNDTVLNLEMAGLRTDRNTLHFLNVGKVPNASLIWGLFVFTAKGLYFDILPSDNWLVLMLERSGEKEEQSEQLISLHDLPAFEILTPIHKWYSFLSSQKYSIQAKFISKDGTVHFLGFQLQRKSSELMERFKPYIRT